MYNLDINKGDTILRGKYRNKKEVVKTFGHDEKGQPTVNGKRILNFNIEKLLPKKDIKEMKKSELKELIKECITEAQLEIGKGSWESSYELLLEGIHAISNADDEYQAMEIGYDKSIAKGLENLYKVANKLGSKMLKVHG